jgi:demethylmenaquinone methyltransferase/2-methoxy-6-polyprenyl-1,4-benzoquinol methylase
VPKTTPTTDRPPAGEYPILPAANRHWLTPFYDLLCELLGLGRRFQRSVLARLGLRGEERLIDVGCGTGTLLAETLRRHSGVTAAGVDADPEILAIAARRLRRYGARVTLHIARAEALPFPDASFDHLTFTYLLRYVDDPAATLAELVRVTRPGGTVAMLEFAVPRGAWRPAWELYVRVGLPLAGRVLSRGWHEVGRFLGPSIRGFYERFPEAALLELWRRAGVSEVRSRRLSLGGGIVVWGVRDG